MALTFSPACLPLPRSGVPAGVDAAPARAAGGRRLAGLAQRGPRESPLGLAAAGFPGLALDGERAAVSRQTAERQIDRLGIAYLRGDRAGGAPPSDYLLAVADQLRQAEQGRPRAIKAELLGPVSLALQATDDQERPLAYDPGLREAVAQHVALRAAWVRDLIEAAGISALIVLDEPFLDALASPFSPLDWVEGGDLLARTLVDTPGARGICAAGEPRWAELLSLPADVIFFDAYEHSAGLVQAAALAAAFLERGGALGWGIVPADPAALAQERVATLAKRFASSVEYLAVAAGVAPERVAGQSLLSTSGTLAHLTAQQASQAVALCVEAAAEARALFGLE
jgi:hypothetical protein